MTATTSAPTAAPAFASTHAVDPSQPAAVSSASGTPATLDGHHLLCAAEIRLGDLLVPVGAQPARTDWAFVLPSDTYLIGHRTTPEGLSPARLFRVYRAHSAPPPPPPPAPAPAPAPAYPSFPYTAEAPTPPAPAATLAALTQAALHLASALQTLAHLHAPARPPAPQ